MDKKNGSLGWIAALTVLVLASLACSAVSRLTSTPTPPSINGTSAPMQPVVTREPRTHPQALGLSMGDPKAPVVVVAYGDFQCPGCQNYVQTQEPGIIRDYIATGKAYYTFVPFSFIDEFPGATGSESKHAAEAAYCASEQGKFWEYHDTLYTNQASENSGGFSDKRLAAIASAVGLDVNKFTTCYNSHKYQQQVLDDEKASEQAGVSQVPNFIVNGKLVGPDDLASAIDAAYKAKGGL